MIDLPERDKGNAYSQARQDFKQLRNLTRWSYLSFQKIKICQGQ